MPLYTLFPLALAALACVVALRVRSGLGLAGVAVFAAAVGPYAAQSWLHVSMPALLMIFVIFDTLALGGLLRGLVAQHPRRLRCRRWLAMAAAFMVGSIAMHGLYVLGMARPLTYVAAVIAFQMAATAILLGVAVGGRRHARTDRRGDLPVPDRLAHARYSEGA